MTNSASITVTNHRLRKALNNANDDDLKSHTQKMGDKIKSELKLMVGEIIKFNVDTETATVKLNGSSKKVTCLIAHDTFSEGMSVVGYPVGTTSVKHKQHIIKPSEKLYGIVASVFDGDSEKKVLLSYINRKKWNNQHNTKNGEYKIEVGDNTLCINKNYIKINSKNLIINGLPYTEAYEPYEEQQDTIIQDFLDKIHPIGSIYMSMNNTNPSKLFGGYWVQIKDTFLLACGEQYNADDPNSFTALHGEAEHTLTIDEMPTHNHKESDAGARVKDNDTNIQGYGFTSSGNVINNYQQDTQYSYTQNKGGGQAHNNMPPYMAVYMWKRIE